MVFYSIFGRRFLVLFLIPFVRNRNKEGQVMKERKEGRKKLRRWRGEMVVGGGEWGGGERWGGGGENERNCSKKPQTRYVFLNWFIFSRTYSPCVVMIISDILPNEFTFLPIFPSLALLNGSTEYSVICDQTRMSYTVLRNLKLFLWRRDNVTGIFSCWLLNRPD